MSTLIIQSLNFNLWLEVTYRQWRLLLLLHFYSWAFWGHIDCWFSSGSWHTFISHTVLMQVSGNIKYNSIFNFYFFKLSGKVPGPYVQQ
jgi:hypothetical protein